jgi:hypothetical protein
MVCYRTIQISHLRDGKKWGSGYPLTLTKKHLPPPDFTSNHQILNFVSLSLILLVPCGKIIYCRVLQKGTTPKAHMRLMQYSIRDQYCTPDWWAQARGSKCKM